jgi:DNA invertase Pin-like site-specific DNA recombinase
MALLLYLRTTEAKRLRARASIQAQEKEILAAGTFATETMHRFVEYGGSPDLPLKRRRKGRLLLTQARPNDTIAASSLDRIFLDLNDAQSTIKELRHRNVSLWIANLNQKMTTESEISLGVLVGFEAGTAAAIELRRSRHRRSGHLELDPFADRPRSHAARYPGIQEQILQLRKEGHSLREIARRVGRRPDMSYSTISYSTVARILSQSTDGT